MKKLLSALCAISLFIAVPTFTGCTTGTTNTTVKVEAGLIPSVNVAMSVWKTRVESGKATQEQVDMVRALYETYYAAQLKLKDALIRSVTTKSPEDEAAVTIAINNSKAAETKLVTTLKTISK